MKCLMISGAPKTGKSEMCRCVEEFLKEKGYSLIPKSKISNGEDNVDFTESFKKEAGSSKKKVLLNYASDDDEIINRFGDYYEQHKPFDIIITTARDSADDNRRIMNSCLKRLGLQLEDIIEVPLGKITRRGDAYESARKWYKCTMKKLIGHILSSAPFCI